LLSLLSASWLTSLRGTLAQTSTTSKSSTTSETSSTDYLEMAPSPDEQYQQQQPNTSRIDSVADCVTMYAVFCTENIPPPVWPHTLRLIASSFLSKLLYRFWTSLSIKLTRAALQWLKMVTLAHPRAFSRPPTYSGWPQVCATRLNRNSPTITHCSIYPIN
jgi:hypothetical protein